jgi:hypothetical protein
VRTALLSLEGLSAGVKMIADFGPGIILAGLVGPTVVAARLPLGFRADCVHTGADLGPGMRASETPGALESRAGDGNKSPPER